MTDGQTDVMLVAKAARRAHGKSRETKTRDPIALASMARDDPPASSTASSTAAAMRGKVKSEFET